MHMTTQTPVKKGLFSRLKDAPPQTAAAVDSEIQAVQAEIVEFERQREEIKKAISDNWGSDSQASEDEFQRLGLRIEAAQTVITRLQQERVEAKKREIVASGVEVVAARVTLNEQDQQIYADIQRLEAELKAKQQARHEVSRQQSWNGSRESQLVHDMEQLGIPREKSMQMFYAAYTAMKGRENGK